MDRRSFLTGFGAALVSAPAIVRAGGLMPVRAVDVTDAWTYDATHFRQIPPRLTAEWIRRLRDITKAHTEMIAAARADMVFFEGSQWTAPQVELMRKRAEAIVSMRHQPVVRL